MAKVLWVAPRYPAKEQILFFRKIINNGKWIDFEYVERVDNNFDFDKYNYVVGTVTIDVLKKIVDEKGKFFKTIAVKFGPRRYRFRGFSKIYEFDYDDVKKLKNGRILSVTRHFFNKSEVELLKTVNNGEIPYVRHISKTVNDYSTIIGLMEKYNTGDVHWITNVAFYNGLVRHGIFPIRFIGKSDDGSYSRIVKITKLNQIVYNKF